MFELGHLWLLQRSYRDLILNTELCLTDEAEELLAVFVLSVRPLPPHVNKT